MRLLFQGEGKFISSRFHKGKHDNIEISEKDSMIEYGTVFIDDCYFMVGTKLPRSLQRTDHYHILMFKDFLLHPLVD